MKIPPAIAAIAPEGQLTPVQRRRFLIDMCRRRIKPGTGSGYEFLHRRTAMTPWPDLHPILQGLPWAITGAVATRAYMPERATKGIDVSVHSRDGDKVLKRLQKADYQIVSQLAIPGFSLRSPDGIEVDVIFGDYPWLPEALAQPRLDPAGYPVLALPYLVLMKLQSSRTQDLGDLSRMFGLASEEDLEQVRSVVNQYAPDAAEDVESLIYLGQIEMKGSSPDSDP
jgi:hypothetical protein